MGRIVGPYGVRGWVKVAPFTEATDALSGYRTWWLVPRDASDGAPWTVESARPHADTVVAKLVGVDDREAAAALHGCRVEVPRGDLPKLDEGEVYVADLIGLTVVNRRGELLGKVDSADSFGAHPVLRVTGDDGVVRLIPFVSAHVESVDVPGGRIEVDWGLDY